MSTQESREWEKEFTERFANPTAKFLGNDFADYPKANIKDVVDFICSIEDAAYERGKNQKGSAFREGFMRGKTEKNHQPL